MPYGTLSKKLPYLFIKHIFNFFFQKRIQQLTFSFTWAWNKSKIIKKIVPVVHPTWQFSKGPLRGAPRLHQFGRDIRSTREGRRLEVLNHLDFVNQSVAYVYLHEGIDYILEDLASKRNRVWTGRASHKTSVSENSLSQRITVHIP